MSDYKLTPEMLVSQEFYKTMRDEAPLYMTLIAICDDGKLYLWDDFVKIILLIGIDFVGLRYGNPPGPSKCSEFIRDCNEAVHDPLRVKNISELFNYLGSFNTDTGEFNIYQISGVDWLGIYPRIKDGSLHRLYYQLPHGWPESYQDTINKLNSVRGHDDALISKHSKLSAELNQILFTISFESTAAAFDAQYGRTFPLEPFKLSPYQLPIETKNIRKIKVRDNFNYEIDITFAYKYLSECGVNVSPRFIMSTPNGNGLEVSLWGLAALAFIVEQLPNVAGDGEVFFTRILGFMPQCEYDYEKLLKDLNYCKIGAGIIIAKSLFEGLLGFGGDFFASNKMISAFGQFDSDMYHGTMCTALELQRRVIDELTKGIVENQK